MFKIIATEDFVNLISEMPLKYIGVLTKSFISVERIEDESDVIENSFLNDIMNNV